MKTHPIIFSTPMVQAILAGRKTMTRRVCKHEGAIKYASHPLIPKETKWLNCPYGYEIGDVLWVRESFGYYSNTLFYKSDDSLAAEKWKPSIHMTKSACRLFLEVVSIRVERLQEITYQDIIKEGMPKYFSEPSPSAWFEYLWDSINGKKTSGSRLPSSDYKSNPFVWVIEFKRIDKPENF